MWKLPVRKLLRATSEEKVRGARSPVITPGRDNGSEYTCSLLAGADDNGEATAGSGTCRSRFSSDCDHADETITRTSKVAPAARGLIRYLTEPRWCRSTAAQRFDWSSCP